MQTPDLTSGNIEKIQELFPNVITEKEGENGVIEKAVDFELLKQMLSKELVEDDNERYRLDWPGKKASLLKANTSITSTLRPDRESSVNFDTTENVFIEGDNFEVLKVLQESYLGKVKMIYIDPPYNTGKDFVYRDNRTVSKEDYEEEIGVEDEEGGKLFRNTDTNGRFHSDWLSMVYERLIISRDLLTDDGVIFISIDDNEVNNLSKIADEIFGEENFIAYNTVVVRPEGIHYGGISKTHEILLVYSKNIQEAIFNEIEVEGADFKFNDSYGGFNLRDLRNQAPRIFNSLNRPNLRFPLWVNTQEVDIDGFMEVSVDKIDGWEKILPPIVDGNESVYQWGRDKIKSENSDVIARQGTDGIIRIYQKRRKTTQKARTLWSGPEFITNRGTREVQSLFDGQTYFDFPKPLSLVYRAIEIGSEKNSIVLDFFAGSATTAHATMKLNADDDGNRKFIMVQLPEETDEKSEAFKAGYKYVSDISMERIRRAGKKIVEENVEKLKERETPLDIGFRVYKTDTTNMKDVYYHPSLIDQKDLFNHVSNIKEDRTPEDLLTQVILDLGLTLDLPIEKKNIKGNDVYFVSNNSLVACFDDKIDFSIVDEIAKSEPLKVVFKDASFKEEQDRTNIETKFKRLSPETIITVL